MTESGIIDTNLPHYLAFIPRDYVERIESRSRREAMLRRWDAAYGKLLEFGEEHPPVGFVHGIPRP